VLPFVGWAERGSGQADGHGNSVPRFHLTWGTGPEVVRVFAEPVLAGEDRGLVRFAFRHQVDELIVEDSPDGDAVAKVLALLGGGELDVGLGPPSRPHVLVVEPVEACGSEPVLEGELPGSP